MSNWVSGYIRPFGTKEQIKEFTDFIMESKLWHYAVRGIDEESNGLSLYVHDAWDANTLAMTMEETFPDIDFDYFVSDDYNEIGWGVKYKNRIETFSFYEDGGEHEYLVVTETETNEITEEYIKERRERRERIKNNPFVEN